MQEILDHKALNHGIILAMGFFDCMHTGHRKLVDTAVKRARAEGRKSAVLTFSNDPYAHFDKDSKLVYTYEERKTIFERLNLDFCIPLDFSEKFRLITKEKFIETLFSDFDIKGLVCGHDYRFGNNGAGDTVFLRRAADSKNIALDVIGPVLIGGERVSTTLIKETLLSGAVEKANRLLSEDYFMTGKIIRGRGEGSKIGFPTANLSVPPEKLLPKHGVYATHVQIGGKRYKSVTNIGPKPTYNIEGIFVETYITGFEGDLYGKNITLFFIKRIRDIIKFGDLEDLKRRIQKDISLL